MVGGRAFLTSGVAIAAATTVGEMIKPFWESGVFKRQGVAFAITTTDSDGVARILHENVFGELDTDHDYAAVARCKALAALREQRSTGEIQQISPQLFFPGDTTYRGGVYWPGFAVGVSGVQDYYDEMIAHWIAVAIVADCIAGQRSFAEIGRDFID